MTTIVRKGNIVMKLDKKGKILEGSSFKTVNAAKRIEYLLKTGQKEHVNQKEYKKVNGKLVHIR